MEASNTAAQFKEVLTKAVGECLNSQKDPPSPRKRSSLATEPCHWAAGLGRCGLGENEEMNFKKHS